MTYCPRNYGHLPDAAPPEEGKTFGARHPNDPAASVHLPSDYSCEAAIVTIGPLFQRNLGTCVTQATMQAMRLFWNLNLGIKNPPVVSRLAWYWDARDDTTKDGGLRPRAAFDTLNARGYCLETYWPYDEAQVFTPPDATCRSHMVDQIDLVDDLAIVASGTSLIRQIKEALMSDLVHAGAPTYSVVCSIECDRGFEDYKGGVWSYAPGAEFLGGHFILIIGWDDALNAFLCVNSWESWGIQKGGCSLFWMAYDEVMSPRCPNIFAIRAAALPSDIQKQPLPTVAP